MNNYFFYTDKMTVGYDGKPLIKEIEIKVSRGEILTLIGPNGAGKSTILKSITRQLKTIAGTVYLDGRVMKQMSDKEISKRLAVVLTERIRPELMTCEEVVATGRYPYTGQLGILTKKDWEKVWEAMRIVSAEDLRKRDFAAISDGQRQRILLARAICQEPEIIILDEPTSFLDIKHKLELLTILKNMVRQSSVAVIMSLHELDLAQKVSDQVVCVHGEYIEKYGTPEEIFTSEYIHKLYGVTSGSYNADFGCLEMEASQGKPEVFVIAGNGSGIKDLDYAVAKTLASRVIAEEAFEEVSQEHYEEALKVMRACKSVVCCIQTFGTMNRRNEVLMREAEKIGILKKEESKNK